MQTEEFNRALKAQIRTLLLLTEDRWQQPEDIAEALGIDADIDVVEQVLEEIVNENKLVGDGRRGILDTEFGIVSITGCYAYDSRVLEEVTA